jgi:DNA-directed RNA polymerase beta subunit
MAKRNGFRKRFDFSKIPATIQIPNLIEVQKRSYERFLQMDRLPSERDDGGLQSVFQSVFPITDFRNVSQLEFVDYAIGNWECKCGHLQREHAGLLQQVRRSCRPAIEVRRGGVRGARYDVFRAAQGDDAPDHLR